jgi:catechol 2,3-dioxygenase-like lactoylglutathione lyase family enzyme
VSGLRPIGFDHIVLVVADVERSLAWYVDAVGAGPVRVEEWRRGEAPFPSVRFGPETIIDLIPGERGEGRGNLDHLCVVVEPTDLAAMRDSGRFDVLDGPATRYGAQGDGTSLYVRDPDGNTVELRYYGTVG